MGSADLSTIKEAITSSRRFNSKIMVDLLGATEERIRQIEKLNPDYFCMHVGIDQQMQGKDPYNLLKKTKTNIPIALAGGLKAENISKALSFGAQIIIVGGAITKASSPKDAAQKIKQAMEKGKNQENPSESLTLAQKIQKISTSNISDAMQRSGEMQNFPIKLNTHLLAGGKKIFGYAIPTRCANGDWAKPIQAIDK